MERTAHLSRLRDLFNTQPLGVLATDSGRGPYSSLVAIAVSSDLHQLVFLTGRATHKYDNIRNNSRVSLLIDNRDNRPEDFRDAMAVTVLGKAREAAVSERDALLSLFLSRHPELAAFARTPDCAVMSIEVQRYIMVSRFQQVEQLEMGG